MPLKRAVQIWHGTRRVESECSLAECWSWCRSLSGIRDWNCSLSPLDFCTSLSLNLFFCSSIRHSQHRDHSFQRKHRTINTAESGLLKMPLPRYSLDDSAEDEEFEESYNTHQANAASSSRHPTSSLANAGSSSRLNSSTPSISGGHRRSTSPPSSSYNAAPPPASSLDIDALLSNTDASHSSSKYPAPSSSSSSSNGWQYFSSSPVARLKPFEQLTLFMATQKASPEILPFPTSPFESLVGQMEQQQSILDNLLHLSSHPDPETEESAGVDEDEFLRLNLVQVDLERCKWLLKQILRSRMDLLQKYAGFVGSRSGEKMKCNAAEQRFVDE